MEKIKFQTQIKGKDMGLFNIHVMYRRITGFATILLGIIAIALAVAAFAAANLENGIIFIFIALIFLAYFPVILMKRGKRSVENNPTFHKPLFFTLDENGVAIDQAQQHEKLNWEVFYKAVEVPWAIYLFSAKKSAFIWPKDQLSKEELDGIRYFIVNNMAPAKRRGVRK